MFTFRYCDSRKEIGLNTSWKTITAIGAFALGLRAATAMAGPLDCATPYLLSAAATAQAPGSQDVDDLLRRARKCMAGGDVKAADALISQAERSGPQGMFHVGDTPKKARADLEKLRIAQSNHGPVAPSKDPFVARGMTGVDTPDNSE